MRNYTSIYNFATFSIKNHTFCYNYTPKYYTNHKNKVKISTFRHTLTTPQVALHQPQHITSLKEIKSS